MEIKKLADNDTFTKTLHEIITENLGNAKTKAEEDARKVFIRDTLRYIDHVKEFYGADKGIEIWMKMAEALPEDLVQDLTKEILSTPATPARVETPAQKIVRLIKESQASHIK